MSLGFKRLIVLLVTGGTELNPGFHSKQDKFNTIIATWGITNAKSKPFDYTFSFIFNLHE